MYNYIYTLIKCQIMYFETTIENTKNNIKWMCTCLCEDIYVNKVVYKIYDTSTLCIYTYPSIYTFCASVLTTGGRRIHLLTSLFYNLCINSIKKNIIYKTI